MLDYVPCVSLYIDDREISMASSSKYLVQVVDLPELIMVVARKVLLVKRHIACHNRVDLCENHGFYYYRS